MKKLTKEDAQDLLRRYRMGLCSKKEIEFIDSWYYSLAHGEKDIPGFEADDLHELKAVMLENINSKIDSAVEDGKVKSREAPVRELYGMSFDNLRRIAAVLLVGAVGFFFYSQFPFIGEVGTLSDIVDTGNDAGKMVEASSPTTVYLSDGSVVWLKGASTLEYPEFFSGNNREVKLTGEAFFDVAADKEKPFIIRSANLTTTVLGTSFNIKAYGDQDSHEVVVVTGRVVVSVTEPSADDVQELVLSPNQKAIYSRSSNSLVEADVTETAIGSDLKKQKLVFDEVSLEDILKVLNASYHADIKVENESMRNCIITADLTEESLESSIGILAKAINATYTLQGDAIILSGNGCGIQ